MKINLHFSLISHLDCYIHTSQGCHFFLPPYVFESFPSIPCLTHHMHPDIWEDCFFLKYCILCSKCAKYQPVSKTVSCVFQILFHRCLSDHRGRRTVRLWLFDYVLVNGIWTEMHAISGPVHKPFSVIHGVCVPFSEIFGGQGV